MYVYDEDFKEISEKCSQHTHKLFHLEGGFLFKGPWFCVGTRVILKSENPPDNSGYGYEN